MFEFLKEIITTSKKRKTKVEPSSKNSHEQKNDCIGNDTNNWVNFYSFYT